MSKEAKRYFKLPKSENSGLNSEIFYSASVISDTVYDSPGLSGTTPGASNLPLFRHLNKDLET